MTSGQERFDELIDVIKSGKTRQLHAACDELTRQWKDVPVERFLHLKEQFSKLDMEHREAHVEDVLIGIAEKRPEPFTTIAADHSHPQWKPAVEVLSMSGKDDYLDVLLSLLPDCPPKNLQALTRAIGGFSGHKVVEALSPYLSTDDEGVFIEVVMALKKCGGVDALRSLRGCLETRRREGSRMCSVLESVIDDMDLEGRIA